jgi:hypothetical protein
MTVESVHRFPSPLSIFTGLLFISTFPQPLPTRPIMVLLQQPSLRPTAFLKMHCLSIMFDILGLFALRDFR